MTQRDFYDRLGDLLKDRLESDEDPFAAWDAHDGKTRTAGGRRARTPPPKPKAVAEEKVRVPQELVEDYFVLGLAPGVSIATCKAAWKRLLKVNHPDRFAGQPAKAEDATRRSIRLTDSYRRIARWFETGKID